MIKRYGLSQKQKLYISKKSASEILRIKYAQIEFVEYVGNGNVLVGMWNDSIILKEEQFKERFRSNRQAKASQLQSHRVGKYGFVCNGYNITITPNWQTCQCQDYQNQREAIGSGECKHILASLNTLGYQSLERYMGS